MPREILVMTGPSATQRVDLGGRPSVITLNQRGKLEVALAAGLTQREAAVWAQTKQQCISYLLKHDSEFRQVLREDTKRARLNPYLRLFQAAGESWSAAAALIEHLEACRGRYSTDELLDSIRLLHGLCRSFEHVEKTEPNPFVTMREMQEQAESGRK